MTRGARMTREKAVAEIIALNELLAELLARPQVGDQDQLWSQIRSRLGELQPAER